MLFRSPLSPPPRPLRVVRSCACSAKMIKDDGKFFRAVTESSWSPMTRLADADRCGVSVHVLSTVPVMFSYWAKPEDCLDLSILLNNHLAGVVAANPRRFVVRGAGWRACWQRAAVPGNDPPPPTHTHTHTRTNTHANNCAWLQALGTIPMQDPDLACAELTRCVRELGMAGVQVGGVGRVVVCLWWWYVWWWWWWWWWWW